MLEGRRAAGTGLEIESWSPHVLSEREHCEATCGSSTSTLGSQRWMQPRGLRRLRTEQTWRFLSRGWLRRVATLPLIIDPKPRP